MRREVINRQKDSDCSSGDENEIDENEILENKNYSQNNYNRELGTDKLIKQSNSLKPLKLPVLKPNKKRKKKTPLRQRSVLILCGSLLCLYVFSFRYNVPGDTRRNVTGGLIGAVSIFLIYGTLQFHDGLFQRPSKSFWRLIKALSILYLMLLSFLLFQDFDDVFEAIRTIDSTVPRDIVEKNYVADCRIFAFGEPNIFVNVLDKLDFYVFAHFFGWFVKALIFRNWILLWMCSLIFEVAEISLKHILPNFQECWWDQLLLDVLGCNLLGMYLGMKVCNLFDMKTYRWRFQSLRYWWSPTAKVVECDSDANSEGASSPTNCDVKKKGYHREHKPLIIFNWAPISWTSYRWTPLLEHHQSYFAHIVIVMLATMFDLNVFFLKTLFHMDAGHWLFVIRTLIMALAASHGVREVYEFLTVPDLTAAGTPYPVGTGQLSRLESLSYRRLGVQAWLDTAMILGEAILVLKWWNHLPVHGLKMSTSAQVLVFSVVFVGVGIWIFLFYFKHPARHGPKISVGSKQGANLEAKKRL